MQAEDDDEDKPFSIFGGLVAEDDAERAEAAAFEAEFSEDDVVSVEVEKDPSKVRFGGTRQETYDLRPSRKYVLYIAQRNALRRWSKTGKKTLPAKIAMITESIRNQVLHHREFKQDYVARIYLVMSVAKRRRMLDKLAWTNLDLYLKVRDELKIRHTYRLECLIGRVSAYKYTAENKPKLPGYKTLLKMQRQKDLMGKRIARALRSDAPKLEVQEMRKKIKNRMWSAGPESDVKSMIAGKKTGAMLDPLNVPPSIKGPGDFKAS